MFVILLCGEGATASSGLSQSCSLLAGIGGQVPGAGRSVGTQAIGRGAPASQSDRLSYFVEKRETSSCHE